MSTRHSYPSGPSRDRDRDRERPRDDRYPAPSRPPLPPQAARFSPPAAPAPARYERAEYPPSGPRDYARAEPPRERERYRDVDPARAGLVKGSYTRAPPREQRRESYERRDSTGHGATSQVAGPLQHCTLHYCTQLTPHVQITPRLAPRLPTAPPPPPPLALTLAPQAPPLPFALPAPQTPALNEEDRRRGPSKRSRAVVEPAPRERERDKKPRVDPPARYDPPGRVEPAARHEPAPARHEPGVPSQPARYDPPTRAEQPRFQPAAAAARPEPGPRLSQPIPTGPKALTPQSRSPHVHAPLSVGSSSSSLLISGIATPPTEPRAFRDKLFIAKDAPRGPRALGMVGVPTGPRGTAQVKRFFPGDEDEDELVVSSAGKKNGWSMDVEKRGEKKDDDKKRSDHVHPDRLGLQQRQDDRPPPPPRVDVPPARPDAKARAPEVRAQPRTEARQDDRRESAPPARAPGPRAAPRTEPAPPTHSRAPVVAPMPKPAPAVRPAPIALPPPPVVALPPPTPAPQPIAAPQPIDVPQPPPRPIVVAPTRAPTPPPAALPPSPPGELYERLVQVGEGTYGKVYKARNVETGALVALKRIRMEAEKDGFPVTAVREIKLLQSLRHPNVVDLREMMVSKGHVYMVFEYSDHDLTGVLHHPSIHLSPAHLKSLMQQFLDGLAFIHQRGVLHRDLKGSNILLSKHGELKIADFGLARFYAPGRGNDYTNRVITQWYKPPELLFGATVYGSEVDMWSAGCIFLELFARRPVFQGQDEIHQLDVIFKTVGTPSPDSWPGLQDLPWYELVKPKVVIESQLRSSFSKWLSPAGLDVAERLLSMDPAKRPTADEALQMAYFREDPLPEMPDVLAEVKGEWHEYESKRARKRQREEAG